MPVDRERPPAHRDQRRRPRAAAGLRRPAVPQPRAVDRQHPGRRDEGDLHPGQPHRRPRHARRGGHPALTRPTAAPGAGSGRVLGSARGGAVGRAPAAPPDLVPEGGPMVSPTRRRLGRTSLLAGATLLAATGLAPVAADAAPSTPQAPPARAALQARAGAADAPSLRSKDPGVMANLFEWNWPSVAAECTQRARPGRLRRRPGRAAAGLAQADRRAGRPGPTRYVRHPWWEVYQAVDYALTSRMGDEQQFQDMVSDLPRGRGEGLRRRGDQPHRRSGHLSYGGKTYDTPYVRPADVPYTPQNFHVPQGECPTSDGGIARLQQRHAGHQLQPRRPARPADRDARTCGTRSPPT